MHSKKNNNGLQMGWNPLLTIQLLIEDLGNGVEVFLEIVQGVQVLADGRGVFESFEQPIDGFFGLFRVA